MEDGDLDHRSSSDDHPPEGTYFEIEDILQDEDHKNCWKQVSFSRMRSIDIEEPDLSCDCMEMDDIKAVREQGPRFEQPRPLSFIRFLSLISQPFDTIGPFAARI